MNKKSLIVSLVVLLLAISGYTGVNALKEYYSLDNTKENTYAAKDVEGNSNSESKEFSDEIKENKEEDTKKVDENKEVKDASKDSNTKGVSQKGEPSEGNKKEAAYTKNQVSKETPKTSKEVLKEENKSTPVNNKEDEKKENNFLVVNGITGQNLFSTSFNEENISVGALTKKILPEGSYKAKGRGSALFFDSIMGLSSGAHGASSGWVFMVKKSGEENYISPSVGAGAYNIQKGDKILWRYIKS
ncbi:DUF4430 domain-containing protein [Clostridium sp.]|uniref:DUF4430 domain-containing protein n=1 Tax=Clostridium sp. TaxID=1506 RepID=UPI003463B017